MLYHKCFIWPELAIFPICKAGCTSIQKAIQSTGKGSKMVGALQPGELDGKKCYAVTRSPFDRLVSFHLNKIKAWNEIDRHYNNEDFGFRKNMPFKDMLEVVCNTPDEESDRHFKSQTALLSPNGKLLVTHSWDISHINDFWRTVQKEIDVPRLDHHRRSQGRKHYRKYYTDETREMVERRYANDLRTFNYGF